MGTTAAKEVFLWVQNSRGMTSMIVCGNCLSHTFRGSADSGEELLRITGGLSTVCFGFYAPEHHGVICRHAPCYGKWGTVCQRFRRWRDKGLWEKLLEILVDEPDFEWLMIDASHCKVHPHAAGARAGNQDMSRTKGGSIPRFTLPWMQMVCRSEYLSQRVPELIAKKLFT